ncbi:hypothetical protein TRFO_25233 [Tritrichomonas foetus]|uniref:Uncharacterized protein n=1 Tax=Tritrichomonas foetus TaxID=1144522 RepID=A0A1J4KAD7_9EUKA|nr:hypothetical protein TRFO_25233 [Tritrichomonas foetus]|eukprot:OHT06630.1 hypothetical protein TRFO_25233 [Tritrichomonas foetus]
MSLLLRAAISSNIMVLTARTINDPFKMTFSKSNLAVPKEKFPVYCDRLSMRLSRMKTGVNSIYDIFQTHFSQTLESLKSQDAFNDNKPKFAMAFLYQKDTKEMEFKCHIFRPMTDKPAIRAQDVHTTITLDFDDDWFVIDTVDATGKVIKEDLELNNNPNEEKIVRAMSNLLKSVLAGGNDAPQDLIETIQAMMTSQRNEL